MKSCELHLVPNCPLCAGSQPTGVTLNPQHNLAVNSPAIPPQTPPEPKITDEHAQKMLAAAEKYAAECEAVKTISEQVIRTEDILKVSREKLKEAVANREAAQAEMMHLLSPSTVTAIAMRKIL